MKQSVLLIIVILTVFSSFGQQKSRLDLFLQENEPNISKFCGKAEIGDQKFLYKTIENEITAFTLLSDGYFTLGTTNGISQESLDDNCQLSFGHPYALTSYPYFTLDGVRHHPEKYFYRGTKELLNQGDTALSLQATDSEKLEFTFIVEQEDSGSTITLNLTIKNIDTIAHQIGTGLLFDPALGLWGDGTTMIEGVPILHDTIIENVPEIISFMERQVSPMGLGLQIKSTEQLPTVLKIGNWFDLHNGTSTSSDLIYDLAAEWKWEEQAINPDETVHFTLEMNLLTPEFAESAFMRSDLPYYLSIENNLLFPREIHPMIKIHNNSNLQYTAAGIQISGDGFVKDWTSPDTIDIAAQNTVYTTATIKFPENYEDKVVSVDLRLMENEQVVDMVSRNVYIPAAPFSDTGLLVEIDTLMASDFPYVDLIFHAQKEETGQPLVDLSTENIFFYENEDKIEDFTMEKDTTGGVVQADIIFVLDVTGSMSEEIDGVKDNIIEFADSLSYQGIDYQLGMVTFLDEIENIYEFTNDVQQFQQYVGNQYAHGGADLPENSLDALYAACQFEFRPAANRVFIWITDASYHINNYHTQLTPQDVVNEMLSKSIVPSGIGHTQYQIDYFNPILLPTGGEFYDIMGNFRDILLEISRLESSGSYLLKYHSNVTPGTSFIDNLEVHYAGLGGNDTITFVAPTKYLGNKEIPSSKQYPNPFYTSAKMEIQNPEGMEARIEIFNVQGQLVYSKNFDPGQTHINFTWDAKDDNGMSICNGLYFVHCQLSGYDKDPVTLPIKKLIYLK